MGRWRRGVSAEGTEISYCSAPGSGSSRTRALGAAFYIWDQGGPAEVTLKQSSAMGEAGEESIHVEQSQRFVEH